MRGAVGKAVRRRRVAAQGVCIHREGYGVAADGGFRGVAQALPEVSGNQHHAEKRAGQPGKESGNRCHGLSVIRYSGGIVSPCRCVGKRLRQKKSGRDDPVNTVTGTRLNAGCSHLDPARHAW